MPKPNEQAIFNEMIRIGSEVVVSDDSVALSKNASALAVLNGALNIEDKGKSSRLLNLARNIRRSIED